MATTDIARDTAAVHRCSSGGIVYFSSVTLNTHRFVEKLGLPAVRIPVHASAPRLNVDDDYVLILPTYGGGASLNGRATQSVPVQVKRFLGEFNNAAGLRGVIAGGNTNFGADFGRAGDLISARFSVPLLYRFELMGTPHDVERVRQGLATFWGRTRTTALTQETA